MSNKPNQSPEKAAFSEQPKQEQPTPPTADEMVADLMAANAALMAANEALVGRVTNLEGAVQEAQKVLPAPQAVHVGPREPVTYKTKAGNFRTDR